MSFIYHRAIIVSNMNIIGTSKLECAGSCAIILKTFFDVCFNIFGKIILNFLHHVYKLVLIVNIRLSGVLFKFIAFRTTVKSGSLNDETLIKSEILLFKKIPHHITLLVSAESPSYRDLVNFITWCIPAGISHVSFYDHHNSINSEVLFDYVCKFAKQYIPLIKWGKSFSEDIKTLSKGHINGYRWEPALTVHVYRSDDWSNELTSSIAALKGGSCDRVDVKILDSVFRKTFLAPDPDLCLVAGNVLSFFGFPPWHLRITQIQEIVPHHNLTVNSFIDALRKYSNCEQRYGK